MQGNSTTQETGSSERILRTITSSLERAIPDTWSVSIDTEPKTTESHGPRTDARLVIAPPTGRAATFVLELKRLDRSPVADVVSQAQLVGELTRLPVVVATVYANPALRAACTDAGIGYVDTTGWISIRSDSPPLAVTSSGASRTPGKPRPTAMTRLNGAGAARIIRTLLAAMPPVGVRELAGIANASPGSVAKLLPALTSAGAIDRDERGAVLAVRRRLLLERWTQDYSYARSNHDVSWLLAPRGIDDAVNRVTKYGGVATGSIAARACLPVDMVPVTPLSLAAFYVADPAALADQAGLVEAGQAAANIVIARPRDESLLAHTAPPQVGPRSVPLPQALADLLTLPGRSPQEADQVMDVLARTDPTWSDEVSQ